MYSQSREEESAPSFPCHLGEASPRPFLPRAPRSTSRSPGEPPQLGPSHASQPGCLRRGLWAGAAVLPPRRARALRRGRWLQARSEHRAGSGHAGGCWRPRAQTPGCAPRGRGRALFTRCHDTRARRSTVQPSPAGPARSLQPAPPSFQRPQCPAGRTAWLARFASRSGDHGYGYGCLEPGSARGGRIWAAGPGPSSVPARWCWVSVVLVVEWAHLGVSLSRAIQLADFGKVSEDSTISWKVRIACGNG